MSKFAISFIVDKRSFGDVMVALQPYRIEDLAFKMVAGTSPTARAGEKPAWEAVGEMADGTMRPLAYFKTRLLEMGFKNGTIYNALITAVQNKLVIKKMIDGKPHYMKRGDTK